MYKDTIQLCDVEQVRKFSGLANKYKEKISLISEDNKINAKSIMGIFTLDLSRPIDVVVESNECPESLRLGIKEYRVPDIANA